jgi:HSP20 family protein
MRATFFPAAKRGNNLPGFENFYNLMDDFFSSDLARSPRTDTFRLDLKETENEYLIEAELPGVKKEEIKVNMEEGNLSIEVTREEKSEDKNHSYIHRERRYQSMQRSIYLPDVDEDGVKAKLNDGVLEITVAKNKKPKRDYTIAIE